MRAHHLRSKILWGAAALAAGLFLTACNPVESDSESATLLVLEQILGQNLEGQSANVLISDVLLTQGGASTITPDYATATLSAKPYTPPGGGEVPGGGGTTPPYGDIQLTRYVVTYSRTDGRNVQGRDVPYAFEGSISAFIRLNTSSNVTFVVVRESAKEESPLVELRDAYPDQILYVNARIEFYGHDLANRSVKAVGFLPIHFANYAN